MPMYLMSGRDLSAQPSRPDPQPTSTTYPLSPGPLTFSVAFLSDQRDGAGFVPEDWLQQFASRRRWGEGVPPESSNGRQNCLIAKWLSLFPTPLFRLQGTRGGSAFLSGESRSPDGRRRLFGAEFPVFFPVNREFTAETGSPRTATTTMTSLAFSCLIEPFSGLTNGMTNKTLCDCFEPIACAAARM
jgi:hypothetical protein